MGTTSPAPARASDSPAETTSHRLRSMRIVGGFLDGLEVEFSPGLNCVIGARGTGKTTVLEFVRFALDALPGAQTEPAACRRIESLVERNLAGGRVEVGIETKDGLCYTVTRCLGDAPIVLGADGSPTGIRLGGGGGGGGLFKADIFSQNEVEAIADRSSSQLALIDNFEPELIRQVSAEIARVERALGTNASALIPLRRQIAALGEELGSMPEVAEKLKGYAGHAGDEQGPVNTAHALKALRDRESRTLAATRELLGEQRERFQRLAGAVGAEAAPLFTPDVMAGPNAARMERVRKELAEAGAELDALVSEAVGRIDRALGSLGEIGRELEGTHAHQELEFRSVVERHEAARSQAAERSRLERRRNELLAKQRQREELEGRHDALMREREALSRELSELRDRRFEQRQSIVDRINTALSPTIRVTLVQSGDPSLYLERLGEALKGARLKHNVVAQKLANAFWPADLVSVVRTRDHKRLIDEAELNADQADRVIAALGESPALMELEAVELVDQPRIELRDGGEYKDSSTLSTGQKCTTILPILLLDSDNPLLVDQPEDNLDNRFVYECVVDSIRKMKARRQLIFVTHNPNIPVLGDAQRVFVLESDGASARVAREGDVDACKDEVVTLLEGGEEAFKERRRRYDY